MPRSTGLVALAILTAAGAAVALAQHDQPPPPKPTHHKLPDSPAGGAPSGTLSVQTPDQLNWVPSMGLPKGAMMAVLEGDPTKEGLFAFRLKFPAGMKVPPHTHGAAERLTVIEGTIKLGLGATADEKSAQTLPAGSFATIPAGTVHFGFSDGPAIIQIHGVGPWGITYLNPADDPRTAAPAPGK